MWGQGPAQIDELIRRLDIEAPDLLLMRLQVRAIREGIRDLYADGLGGSNACVTTLSGKIIGGDAAQSPLLDSQLGIVGAVTGTDYGTFLVPTGEYEIGLVLDPADV